MDDYNRYVTAVNKIYDYLEKMKAGWNNMDNKNYIDNIDDYKSIVTSRAEEFKLPRTVQVEKTENLEEEVEEETPEDQHRQQPPPPPMPPQGGYAGGSTGGMTVSVGNRNLDVPGLPASFVPSDIQPRVPVSEGLVE